MATGMFIVVGAGGTASTSAVAVEGQAPEDVPLASVPEVGVALNVLPTSWFQTLCHCANVSGVVATPLG
jgi:hypothetical protein